MTPEASAACARCGYDKANHKREAHAFIYPDSESFLAGLDDLGDCTPEEAVEAVKAVRASAALRNWQVTVSAADLTTEQADALFNRVADAAHALDEQVMCSMGPWEADNE